MLIDPQVRRVRLDEGLQVTSVWLAARRAAFPAIPAPAHSDDDVRRWFVEEVLPERAKEQSHDGLDLWTFEMNVGSHHFHERHEFVLVELTDGHHNEEHAPDRRYR